MDEKHNVSILENRQYCIRNLCFASILDSAFTMELTPSIILAPRTRSYNIDYFPQAVYFTYIPVDNHPDRFNATSIMIDLQEIMLLPKRFGQSLSAQSTVPTRTHLKNASKCPWRCCPRRYRRDLTSVFMNIKGFVKPIQNAHILTRILVCSYTRLSNRFAPCPDEHIN